MMLYTKNQIEKTFNLDLETIAAYKSLDEMPEDLRDIWMDKYHFKWLEKEQKFLKEQRDLLILKYGSSASTTEYDYKPTPDQIYLKYAALHAEYSKVIVATYGVFDPVTKKKTIESIAGTDEKKLLTDLAIILNSVPSMVLAGYNIIGFDIPVLIKKMLKYKIALPFLLQLRGKKPWELTTIDIMADWKSTSYDPISLDLLCVYLGIPTPKDTIKNWQVSTNFHNGTISIEDITKYCEKDVLAAMTILEELSN